MSYKHLFMPMPLVGGFFKTNPTPEDVKAFWEFMTKHYGTKVVRKSDSTEMEAVAELLDLMRIVDKQRFLEDFTTIIPIQPWKGIYIPFEIGVASSKWSLWAQVEVCVHEHEHLVQCKRDGDLRYAWDYVTNSAARAHHEAGGYACNMEIRWRYRREMPTPDELASKLVHYGCSLVDIDVTRKELALRLPIVRRGGLVQSASRIAAPWLDARFHIS